MLKNDPQYCKALQFVERETFRTIQAFGPHNQWEFAPQWNNWVRICATMEELGIPLSKGDR